MLYRFMGALTDKNHYQIEFRLSRFVRYVKPSDCGHGRYSGEEKSEASVIPAEAGHAVKPWHYPEMAGCRIQSGMTKSCIPDCRAIHCGRT